MRTIIVGYDDSEPSKRALERAAEFATAFGSGIVVTSVAPVTNPTGGRSIGADPADTAVDHRAELATARAYLDERGLYAEFVEAVGHPADAIIAAAQEHDGDMIIVGTRETGFMTRLIGNSVSDTVSHRASCDVLIVH